MTKKKRTTTTFAVHEDVADRVREKARLAGMTMIAFVDTVLDWALQNMTVRVKTEGADGDQGPAE